MTKTKPELKPSSFMPLKSIWQWPIISGLIGFFVIHPCVMITAHLMFQPGLESNYSIVAIMVSEFSRVFSSQMLPWGFAFAVISAMSGFFFGRNRQMTCALKQSEQKFRKLSITDDLTGIYNSRYFFNRLQDEIERANRYGHPLSLLILDLDNFKKYNDTHGHVAGDEVLAKTGEILLKSLRKTDSAYRYGGEEFTVILPETGGNQAVHFAERIRQDFERHAILIRQGGSLSVTASIGIAQYKQGEEISAFIKRADENMYTAKRQGKNRIFLSL